jgi:pilus assembly protein CpaF
MPVLAVTESGNPEEKRYDLTKKRFTIGKQTEGNSLVLERNNISRQHCEIIFYNNQYIVKDLNSSNGTFVNGQKIAKPVILKDGCVITLGDFSLRFIERDAPQRQVGIPVPVNVEARVYLKIRDLTTNHERNFPITKNTITLGKADEVDVVLPRNNISRRHCEILFQNNGYYLKDLGSANGTYVNNVRLTAPIELYNSMKISLKEFEIIFVNQDDKRKPPKMEGEEEKEEEKKTWRHLPKSNEIPVDLKQLIHEKLINDRELKTLDFSKISPEEAEKATTKAVLPILNELAADMPQWITRDWILREILQEALGLGPLEDLLGDKGINEIMVNGWNRIFIEKHRQLVLSEKKFVNDEALLNVIRRILAPIGRRIDESSPYVNARLKDGSRVNAIISPLAISGPALTIRKFPENPFGLEDIVKFGTLTQEMGTFLRICVQARRNIVIAGGTGSGKTTLLNMMAMFIPESERIITVEDSAELKIRKPNLVCLEAKPANLEGKNAIPIRTLVINCLRMRPDRIVVGECRAGEAFDMLQAMNTGHDGSLTTVHANSPDEAVARLENLILMAGMDLPSKTIREQIASGVHLLIQQSVSPMEPEKFVTLQKFKEW